MLQVEDLISREGDWTVRLINKKAQRPEQVIFGLLLFDGRTGYWLIRFVTRKKIDVLSDRKSSFLQAKQLLLGKVQSYLDGGYKVTRVTSAYCVTPW